MKLNIAEMQLENSALTVYKYCALNDSDSNDDRQDSRHDTIKTDMTDSQDDSRVLPSWWNVEARRKRCDCHMD